MVYLKSVENVIPLSKLIGLLFLFCLPLLSILFLKTKRNDLARPVMGTIFLVGERAKRARRYLVMFMETRDILCILCTSVSNTHARVSVLRIKFKSKETEDFLA